MPLGQALEPGKRNLGGHHLAVLAPKLPLPLPVPLLPEPGKGLAGETVIGFLVHVDQLGIGPQEFLAAETQQGGTGLVEFRHPAVAVHAEDAVGGGFHQGAEQGFPPARFRQLRLQVGPGFPVVFG